MKRINLNEKSEKSERPGYRGYEPVRPNKALGESIKPKPQPREPFMPNRNLKGNEPTPKRLRRKSPWKFVLLFLVLAIIGGGVAFALGRWNNQIANNSVNSDGQNGGVACTDILNPECWTQAFKPQLLKADNKTSVLIVGVDTRSTAGGQGLRNTDTIMLATMDHQTKQTRLTSLPRDLYAPYGCTLQNQPYKEKINAVYSWGESTSACGPEKDGMKVLKATVEKITGEKIQYSVLIRLEGVVKAIDGIGGVEIDVAEDYTDVYPYDQLPERFQKTCNRAQREPGRGFCIFNFKAGKQTMDGDTALVYARMRYWSRNGDFDRARRQQQVISAVKAKISGDQTDTLTKAQNLLSIYTNLASNIEIENFNIETILAGLDLLDEVNMDPLSIVLDPSFGGGGVIVAGQGSNYNFKDYTFKQTQDKLKLIYNNPELYRDSAKIYAQNTSGVAWTNDNPMMTLKNSGLWFVNVVTDTKPKNLQKTGVEIVDYTNGEMTATVEKIKADFEAKGKTVTVVTADETNNLKPTAAYKENIAVYIYPDPVAPAADTAD